MLDQSLRAVVVPRLEAPARRLVMLGMTANQLTAIGLIVGIAACLAVAAERWWLGLALWIANRIIDGFDGVVARLRGPTELGGFLDIMADFAVYGGVVVAVGFAVPEARVAALVTFLAYYLSGSSFLAWSSLSERLQLGGGDGRSLNFPAGLAEGTETIAAMCLLLAFPQFAVEILWVWAAMVFISVGQRIWFVSRHLQRDRTDRAQRESAE